MAYSARSLSTNLLQQAVLQTAHGFTVGQIVRFNGSIYVLAQADTLSDASSVGMVSFVTDANHFYVTQAGYVSQLTNPVVPGTLLYLSPSVPGGLTSTRPATVGQMIVPLFIGDTTTSGYMFNNAPEPITAPVSPPFAWSVVNVNTAMAINNGYIINGGLTLTMTLPASASAGDLIEIAGSATPGWIIAQNAGQTVHMGNINTTTGVGGSIASTNRYDSIRLICTVANTDFVWLSGVGNLTIV